MTFSLQSLLPLGLIIRHGNQNLTLHLWLLLLSPFRLLFSHFTFHLNCHPRYFLHHLMNHSSGRIWEYCPCLKFKVIKVIIIKVREIKEWWTLHRGTTPCHKMAKANKSRNLKVNYELARRLSRLLRKSSRRARRPLKKFKLSMRGTEKMRMHEPIVFARKSASSKCSSRKPRQNLLSSTIAAPTHPIL